MTIAEKRANEYYPKLNEQDDVAAWHGFIAGYEQAEKNTIERAVSWLKEHANEYIVDVGVGYGENGRNVELIVGGKCWEHLKQALEDGTRTE